jgi:hypothetical protein
MSLPIINSHNSWSRLEEVWLGDVYPSSWYNHLPAQIQDVFYQLTELTQKDLSIIQQMIESFGVTVRRPTYENIEHYINIETKQLTKPQICPRDHFVTLGNNLIAHKWHTSAWQLVLNDYSKHTDCQITLNNDPYLNGANVVRLGERLIIDTPCKNTISHDFLKDYQVTIINNGGHVDGCFAILKPGLILASEYYSQYDQTFPQWKKIFLDSPEFSAHAVSGGNGKWLLPVVSCDRMFNEHVIKHAQDWVGNYTETYFDLNCLVIDEQNVLMLGYNVELEKILKQHGITIHWAPFRTRSFWDGGLHCLTVDIRRQSSKDAKQDILANQI